MKKKMKKAILLILAVVIFFPFLQTEIFAHEMETGIYNIPVHLWNATKDEASLGNQALQQTGKLVVEEEGTYLYLKFVNMSFSGMEGYLMQLNKIENIVFNKYGYPDSYDKVAAEVCSVYDVVDEYNSEDSTDENCAGKKYPKVIKIPVDMNTEYTWAHVYVPIMGSLGFGDQLCRIKADYTAVTVMSEEEQETWAQEEGAVQENTDPDPTPAPEPTEEAVVKTKLKVIITKAEKLLLKTNQYTENSLASLKEATEAAQKVYDDKSVTQTAVDKQVTAVQTAIDNLKEKSTENLDKDNLEDGKYTISIDIWHAVSDKESMGNPAVNKEALLTVKSGTYTMEISTKPMVLGTITACLKTVQIKQTDGSYKYAKVAASNNTDNQPSVFRFQLPEPNEYTDIKINPMVEIMGNQPLDARLRIYWDTLTSVADNTKVKEDTTTNVVDNGDDGTDTPTTENESQSNVEVPDNTQTESQNTSTVKKSTTSSAATTAKPQIQSVTKQAEDTETKQADSTSDAGIVVMNQTEKLDLSQVLPYVLIGFSLFTSFIFTCFTFHFILKSSKKRSD